MLGFGKMEIAKEESYASKKTINIWDINIGNIVISKLIKTKTVYKYLIGYLDKSIRPLVLILPKMSGYVKPFKDKDKNNKLMYFWINEEKLLEKYKTIYVYVYMYINKLRKNFWRLSLH